MWIARRWLETSAIAALLVSVVSADPQASQDEPAREAVKTALAEFNSLIGGWRGVGQPQRNSTKDAWTETADWTWRFDKDSTALRYSVKDGKLLQSADLSWDPERKLYTLSANFAGDVTRSYAGKLAGDKLALDSQADADGYEHRVTVTRLNEKRTLVLLEKRKPPQTFYTRVAEVGYTRQGTSLAVEGAGEPECIVSGGKGTIRLTYKGETYYVCCTGCKQAFEDDPQGIIDEYLLKLAERAKKAKN